MRNRAIAFAILAVVCVGAAVAAGALAIVGTSHDKAASAKAFAKAAPKAQEILASGRPFAAFRLVDRKQPSGYGRGAIATLDGGTPGTPVLAGPTCSRVAVGAHEGLCLDLLGTSTSVEVLDRRLHEVHSFETAGVPSRARVSPSGRWGGVTTFVVGHAYAAPGTFSTATTLVDMRTGKPVADIEKDFKVYDGSRLVDAQDKNYWGLTFAADDDTFYATLATGEKTWLIKGSIKARTAHTIHANVECPSLSPDGTRIGYKKAVAQNPKKWRFTVLDLATGKETPLSETRSVDDQLAWLDNGHLLYSDGATSWVVDADGSGTPRRWLANSDSPTVQEGTGTGS
jgi:hypothetical protein